MNLLQTQWTSPTFLDIELFNVNGFVEFLIRFCFNTQMIFLLVRFLYYPKTRRRDYIFTFMMLGTAIFLLCFMLGNVKLQIGMALGLFAIFGILRYRTVQISIKEMTYLFMVIGISVVNALTTKKVSYAEVLLANVAMIGMAWLSEYTLFRRPLVSQAIVYDKIELINRNQKAELYADLESRLGYKIRKIDIDRISFLRDTAKIRVFYFEDEKVESNTSGK